MENNFITGAMGTGATYAFDDLSMRKSGFYGNLGKGQVYYGFPPDALGELMHPMTESIKKAGNDILKQVLKPKGIVPMSKSINKDKLLETYISMSQFVV